MGICNSKNKHKYDKRPKTPARVVKYTAGDERNMALLRFCNDNDTSKITTSLNSGTDLASPYNGAPLLVSAVLGLLNDDNKQRFVNNWALLANSFNKEVPNVLALDLRVTNFTLKDTNRRSTCHPYVHISGLKTRTIQKIYPYPKSISIGELNNCNLKDVLLFIMTNIESKMQEVTEPDTPNYFVAYKGSVTEKMVNVIVNNAQFVIDDINRVASYWNTTVTYQNYYANYHTAYTMPPPPYQQAVAAPPPPVAPGYVASGYPVQPTAPSAPSVPPYGSVV